MSITLKRSEPKPKPEPDAMTLVEHLSELRRRVLVALVCFVLAAVVAFLFYNHILSFLQRPYCQVQPKHCSFYVTAPLEGLSLRIKIAAYGGAVLASPVLLWELWRFITPGLNPKEKRYAVPFVVASVTLFLLGCLVAFFTFPHALAWLDAIGGNHLQQIFDPVKYLSLIVLLMTAFGITFEFPVLLVALQLAGIITPAQLSKWRRWAIIAIVVLAGVVTPSSDPFSMLAMAVPMYVFYEASIVAGKLFGR